MIENVMFTLFTAAEQPNTKFDVQNFVAALRDAVKSRSSNSSELIIQYQPIIMDSYVGLPVGLSISLHNSFELIPLFP